MLPPCSGSPRMVREDVTVSVTADVRASDVLDRLVVTPRDAAQRHLLSRALRTALPQVKLRASSEGLWVAAAEADSLLAVTGALELRWSQEARRFAENRRV